MSRSDRVKSKICAFSSIRSRCVDLTVEDARRAVDEGVDAIVVSNHGGNVLDGDVPTLRVLPEIVDAVGDQIEVLMDGGVRRGSDVVNALALGAKAVSLGRAYVYPLLAAGEPGCGAFSRCSAKGSTGRSPPSAYGRSTTSTRPTSSSPPAGPGCRATWPNPRRPPHRTQAMDEPHRSEVLSS